MHNSNQIRAGNRVEILQPLYVSGRIGIILAPEELVGRQPTDRWIIQVESDDVLLSLNPTEFRLLS
ncbi:hypothetical protein [Thermocoleostomius sinensis]|uniref:Uncharacterized protein n=1 Tax=Thermocoleostomius sinensis A174 TaxID=2016057 RepID=A0A9E8ZFI0_9CYAN|nr:hypothetical protein [Thermocoleostomius sinensis]WAL62107.1 hypothetical protein OXH18_09010 [Thermocoleostomius sinensis A174]